MRVGFCLFFLFLASPIRASIFDMIPVVSQVKSMVQAIAGDTDGARQTQENFVDFMPVVSQVKTLVQVAVNDGEGARRTKERFDQNMENIVDATPVIGQIKGVTHLALGEEERGVEALKKSTVSSAAFVGAAVAGPAGAIAGSLVGDSIITQIQTAEHGKPSPYGTAEYVENIGKKNAGEHVDQWAGVVATIRQGRKKENKAANSIPGVEM